MKHFIFFLIAGVMTSLCSADQSDLPRLAGVFEIISAAKTTAEKTSKVMPTEMTQIEVRFITPASIEGQKHIIFALAKDKDHEVFSAGSSDQFTFIASGRAIPPGTKKPRRIHISRFTLIQPLTEEN